MMFECNLVICCAAVTHSTPTGEISKGLAYTLIIVQGLLPATAALEIADLFCNGNGADRKADFVDEQMQSNERKKSSKDKKK